MHDFGHRYAGSGRIVLPAESGSEFGIVQHPGERVREADRIARLEIDAAEAFLLDDVEKSLATCRGLGLDPLRATDAVFSADPDWLLGGGTEKDADKAAREGSGPVRVALNLNYDIENPDNWELFLERLAAALEQVHAVQPIEVHALPMQVGFKQHDDGEILRDFAGRVPGIAFHQHEPRTHSDAARLIRSCDLLVSERLHAIVVASILGVPSYVLAYDVKVRELAAMLDLTRWMTDINAPFAAEDLASALGALLEQRAVIAAEVHDRSAVLGAEARHNFDAARAWVAGRAATAKV